MLKKIDRWGWIFALWVVVGALLLSASIPIPAQAKGRTPFLGPVPKPVCQPGDRTEGGVDGQLTLAERTSGASKRPYNCNLSIVGE